MASQIESWREPSDAFELADPHEASLPAARLAKAMGLRPLAAHRCRITCANAASGAAHRSNARTFPCHR